MSEEIWKDIIGFEGFYQVSSLGKVRRGGYELKPGGNGKYKQVVFCVEGQKTTHRVSILVAKAFIPNPLGLPIVAHDDDDGENNCVENLKWSTQKGNWEDRRKNGNGFSGETAPSSKLKWPEVREIRRRKALGEGFDFLAKEFHVSSSCVQNIVYNKTWRE